MLSLFVNINHKMDLSMIVARFESASRGLERNKEIRQELAHEIDEFLNKRVHRQRHVNILWKQNWRYQTAIYH